ncbi:hypothetical protein GCM10023082_42320 [Streptomyces tremellae]|uniref:Uncharacterized protein n=1 Tax=Streptomyces tremellae TaxID=1124239 RepID=A0ABP7FJ28_9ACTN
MRAGEGKWAGGGSRRVRAWGSRWVRAGENSWAGGEKQLGGRGKTAHCPGTDGGRPYRGSDGDFGSFGGLRAISG